MQPLSFAFRRNAGRAPLSDRDIAVIRREALRLATECRGETLVSEILAHLIEHEERLYRELCDRSRDPGAVVRRLLPADLY